MTKTISIGGASGFWGESAMATPQFLRSANVDYIVYDYLAEITMSIMARAKAKNPDAGYATDFVTAVMKPNLQEIAQKGVRILSNAGGVNPEACGAAIRALVAEQNLNLTVAVVTGDDLMPRKDEFGSEGIKEMFSGETFPDPAILASMNAYLGAFPIARALAAGADIVVTGRVVDSAVTLAACIHEFGWRADDWNRLAQGSLAGHILECGPQATGGNFTDWHTVAETLATIGYPIAEVSDDGTFVCTKPDDTGGAVNVGTVSEQMLYEIGDPQAYFLPDVVCDFSQVKIEDAGANRVKVSNAIGYGPPDTYKVCATYADGFRGGTYMSFIGLDADKKAKTMADAAITRARETLRAMNQPDYTETSVEVIGGGSQYGDHSRSSEPREVVLKLAAKHESDKGISLLLREATGLALATPPGLSGFAGSRAKPSPMIRLFSFLLPRARVPIEIDIDGKKITFQEALGTSFDPKVIKRPEAPQPVQGEVDVPLVKLAWGRSGDKGNKANIGIIARDAAYLPYIWASLSEDAVKDRFSHFLEGDLERFYMPGPKAINFLLHEALGGGGVASLRNDPQGKAYAQILLDHPISVPKDIAEKVA